MEIIYEIRESIDLRKRLVTKDETSIFFVNRTQGTLSDLYPNHIYPDPEHVPEKVREVKTGVLLIIYILCYIILTILFGIIVGIVGIQAAYISLLVICVVLGANLFKINQSIKVKKLEKHGFVKYETKKMVAIGYFILCVILMIPYADIMALNNGNEDQYKTGSQAKIFGLKCMYISIIIILESMMQTYFTLSNLNFQMRRKIIVDCNVPRLISIDPNTCNVYYPLDQKVLFNSNEPVTAEMIGNRYETKLARTAFQEYQKFTSYFDSVILVEGIAFLIIVILLSIQFSVDGFLGPMDTAALCSCLISLFSTYYISYQHRRLNTIITQQMKYITLPFNGLLDRIGFDEIRLIVSAIITVILTIILKS